MMRRFTSCTAIALLLAAVAASPTVFAQSKAKAENVAEIPYDSVIFTKMPPGLYLGESIGTRGTGPLQFRTPHTIAVDAKGLVYVGDRGNTRVQVLDNDLNFLRAYDNVGNPWAICVSNGPHQYLFVSNSWPDSADETN